jgi:GntR family transcriptional repressor for pyruvate dehydrogenase complex
MFERIQKSTHSDKIIEKVKGLIISKKLGPGDRLPTERDLAEQFGVSRASIREAISALVAMGLLKTFTGNGTYVNNYLSDDVLKSLSLAVNLTNCTEKDVEEARKSIEPAIAELAALHATDEDKNQLQLHLVAMQTVLGDPIAFTEEDLKFHLATARATHNPILFEIMVGLHALLRGLISTRISKTAEQQKICLQEHTSIFHAIENNHPDIARQIMLRSISRVISPQMMMEEHTINDVMTSIPDQLSESFVSMKEN